jgi:beta-glucosidase
MTNYTMHGRTYRYFVGDPMYPFGYGLSYSKFVYDYFKCADVIKAGERLKVTGQVANMGPYDGDEVSRDE